ncbi:MULTISPECIES: MFS transporter [unclassified Microcella]|uniref:MFS transporter n=1 Tax=unclassified Microcella TaxID=2630066 RepID=UPI0006FA451C|nr:MULTISPECIES: MFS transporter [unclassified Microcella]KQV24566.1 hypothetical protein ASC54_08505 [Yonghaparkia sp. Root332]KRF30859.1 hypothetical protein ASG83_08335 [Yonghaparkia sp. Soil809]
MTTPARPRSSLRRSGGRSAGPAPGLLALLAVLVIAGCLRAPITAVPPVLTAIGLENGIGALGLGVLSALPLAGFSAASLLAIPLARTPGPRRAILLAAAVLTGGILLRSVPDPVALWAGTAVLGFAIAVGNVLLPVVVKELWPRSIAAVTGVYTAASAVMAAIAAATIVPLTVALGGDWRSALGAWSIAAASAALVWWAVQVRGRVQDREVATSAPSTRGGSLARVPLAWSVMLYMGLQAATYYALLAWIPGMERSIGIDDEVSGIHLAIFIGVGIVSGLLASGAAQALPDQRWLSAGSSALLAAAALGALLAPQLALLWIVIAGVSCGAVFPVAVAFIGLRSDDRALTARLSAFVQFGGYLIAMAGPAALGAVAELTGGWEWTLVAIALLSVLQSAVGYLAGGARTIDDRMGIQRTRAGATRLEA